MAARNKIKEIEAREQKPIATIFTELYALHGSQAKVAQALGVSPSTVCNWLVRLGLKEHTILVTRPQLPF